jgi:diphthine synthase
VCATEHLHGTCDLGRGDERDITLKGLDAIQRSSRIYLEAYTSILGVSHDKLVSHAP